MEALILLGICCGIIGGIAAAACCANSSVIKYRCRIGNRSYEFDIKRRPNGTFDIYSRNRPPNRRFSNSPAKAHVYSNGKVSVTAGHAPRSLDQAKAIAKHWATGYHSYLSSGVFFNGPARMRV
ncbi:hypothetical protein Mal52_13740 [Symmachiella dynata]|uniref:Uncharacterized protein n=1 Tax=Symmachiella dynata TaxID=2527995 RepID=A0A517ZKC8_9PLAN|nr:hypothetical protein [Symmachiella dynata]QDU42905.1 hypothetical protein Mal52_13740 [Symmachiella dynata]